VAWSALSPALASGQMLNAKLKSGQTAVHAVCVMPVEADWTKVAVMVREPSPEEADEWSTQLWPVIVEAVVKTGAEDASGAIAPQSLSKDENARQGVFQLQKKFDAMAKLEHWHAGGIKRGRFSLGDEVALAPCAAHADALLFVRGKVSVPVVQRFAQATLQLTLVDASSGEVLAQDTIGTLNDTFLRAPKEAYLDILVRRFRGMRLGSP
jgi:hypothetical protein